MQWREKRKGGVKKWGKGQKNKRADRKTGYLGAEKFCKFSVVKEATAGGLGSGSSLQTSHEGQWHLMFVGKESVQLKMLSSDWLHSASLCVRLLWFKRCLGFEGITYNSLGMA